MVHTGSPPVRSMSENVASSHERSQDGDESDGLEKKDYESDTQQDVNDIPLSERLSRRF